MEFNENLLQKIATHVAIFKGMSRQCLINTLNCSDSWPVNKGESFFKEGDKGQSFFIILGGQVCVEKLINGQQVELAVLKAGECFGEMALVDGKARSATVRALADTISLRFSREKLETYPEAGAHIYRNIAKISVSRLAESNNAMAQLKTQVAALTAKVGQKAETSKS
jgi:CRP-like cAMP-binding protein